MKAAKLILMETHFFLCMEAQHCCHNLRDLEAVENYILTGVLHPFIRSRNVLIEDCAELACWKVRGLCLVFVLLWNDVEVLNIKDIWFAL